MSGKTIGAFFFKELQMIRKTSILAAVAENTRTVYVGGHNPAAFTRIEIKPQPQTQLPYALTGSETTQKSVRTQNIWVGNRFVGAKVVER